MKVCIPVSEVRGLESPVHGHFGSAPAFLAVDSETLATDVLANGDREHVHGACSPVRALAGAKPAAVLVGGLGAGALAGLRQMGIRVYLAPAGTVGQAVRLFAEGKLEELVATASCGGHAHGSSGCGHG